MASSIRIEQETITVARIDEHPHTLNRADRLTIAMPTMTLQARIGLPHWGQFLVTVEHYWG
jgi:hypothetical protein